MVINSNKKKEVILLLRYEKLWKSKFEQEKASVYKLYS